MDLSRFDLFRTTEVQNRTSGLFLLDGAYHLGVCPSVYDGQRICILSTCLEKLEKLENDEP